MEEIVEGKTKIKTYVQDIVTKDMPVFYNPEKKFDRDLSIDFLKAVNPKDFIVCDLLAATGIRGIRMANETEVRKLLLNDANPKAHELIKKNLELNRINNAEVYNQEANRFLLNNEDYYEYLDIDPFGSPIGFLKNGIKKMRKNGFLAITATDSATLTGRYPKKCKRIYGSKNMRTEFLHEIGLRILIKKAIEIGLSQEIALVPVFSHRTKHYFRAYFKIKRNRRSECDKLSEKIGHIWYNKKTMQRGFYKLGERAPGSVIGPLWLGQLCDKDIVKNMGSEFAKSILRESGINRPWYFHIHEIFSLLGTKAEKTEFVLNKLRENGFNAFESHFEDLAIKTDATIEQIKKVIQN